ncbi:2,3-diketo-5-methylthio-1-phosphopentane phosphatase [Pseudovirgaria hyperparasitica]|uniref:2,3-diketo-5-methylthio-1-phosphopentane phosphatase n=1 Tax=Pseudovirgaria hyperparasitica TaxID=470096 RepID=A0A6A6VZQ8_9PEZI|nr:2,3-diketo-5-methylthio-1-phosphopentane phosphatase [Pseudovirgaria hyperparasitica]KAF2755369.1 2,3-diketo-5-methylthio-1-phosphopentane phosphatase [Pseudovirgaria hyperparasitica]
MCSWRGSGLYAPCKGREGTICSIAFVKDVLYPYFTKALPQYLTTHWTDPTIQTLLPKLPSNVAHTPEALQAHFLDLVARDIKDPVLKELQGHIWTKGYTTTALTAPLYPDVIPFFHALRARVRPRTTTLAIYSSGSVQAQKLLFAHIDSTSFPPSHSESPSQPQDNKNNNKSKDITPYFHPHFYDTQNAGPKTDPASYTRILHSLGTTTSNTTTTTTTAAAAAAADKVTFFTDNPAEADAAQAAGLYVIVLVRPGNAVLGEGVRGRFACVEGFEGVLEGVV